MSYSQDFQALGLSDDILTAISEKGFETPSPIQKLTIPVLLNQENDIIAQAQTGTGKTAAFGLPLLHSLHPQKSTPQALILVPTRELAIQVTDELISFNKYRKLSLAAIYGGASMSEQLRRLQKGIDIVVGTPGRILDHIRRGTLVLDKASFLVLDEADEMLNMGFIDDIEQIMQSMTSEKRVLLFSATMPQRIVSLSKKYMRDTEILKVEAQQITTDLTSQIYFEVRESDKFDALTRIIDVESEFYGIVFSRTKVGVDEIVNKLLERGYAAEGLHGDVSQAQREKILRKFKNRHSNILVATDVAARGIDINNLTHVINYSLPQDSESYVHRIGRTGRAGNQGTAITFISNSELRQFGFMRKAIKADIKKEELPSAQDIVAMKKNKIKDDLQQIIESENFHDCSAMAAEILGEHSAEVALSALLRLAFKNELSEENYPEIRTFSVDKRGKARLFISIGRIDGYDARKMVALIKRESGIPDSKIDDVKVMDSYSFATVPFTDAEKVIRKLNSIRKGERPIAEIAKDSKSEGGSSARPSGGRERKGGFSRERNGERGNERGSFRRAEKRDSDKASFEKSSVYERDGNGEWFSIFERRFEKGSESGSSKPARNSEKKRAASPKKNVSSRRQKKETRSRR